MPTYEYECTHCKHHFERFQKMTDPSLKRCPKCRHKVNKVPGSGAGIIFRGSGFYQTDYRSEKYNSAARKEVAPAGESKTDAKPEGVKKKETRKTDGK